MAVLITMKMMKMIKVKNGKNGFAFHVFVFVDTFT